MIKRIYLQLIKSAVSTFPIVVIIFRGCVPEVAVPLYDVGFIYIYIYILGKLGFVSFITVQFYDMSK